MYCRFCGKELPEGAEFCPKCGKRQEDAPGQKTETVRQEEKGSPVMLILTALLFALGSRTVVLALALDRRPVWICPAAAAVMLVVLIALCVKGKIRFEAIRADALLVPLSMLILTVGSVYALALYFKLCGYGYGPVMASAAQYLIECVAAESSVDVLDVIWQWGLLILFLLLRSGNHPPRKRVTAVLMVILLAWMAARGAAAPYLAEYLGAKGLADSEVYWFTFTSAQIYFFAEWVRQIIVYCFVILAGTGKLGKSGTILFSIVSALCALVLLAVFAMGLCVAQSSLFALAIGYLLGFLVLLSARFFKTNKRQNRA